MKQQKPFIYLFLVLIGLVAVLVGVFVFHPAPKRPSTTGPITITVDGAGVTRLDGVPVPTKIIRDTAISALGAARVNARFQPPTNFSNTAQETKTIETLMSMTRAGLLKTNTNQSPSPYE